MYPAASGQWGNIGQQYPSSPSHYSPTYHHGTGHDLVVTQPLMPGYEGVNERAGDGLYRAGYHSTASAFSMSDNPMSAPPTNYGQVLSPLRQPHLSHRSGFSQTHSPSHSRSHSQTQPFSHQQPQSQPYYPRSRSHSQTQPYISPPTSPVMVPQHPSSHLPSQISLSQSISISSQYPATPSRPFSCDLCALSFNRQHDLKRHRETHTGEKPYLCNGGCGKTFTRKDALKRHQLVKGCGRVDDAWP